MRCRRDFIARRLVVYGRFPSLDLVASNTRVAAGNQETHAVLLAVQVLLGQIHVVERIAHMHKAFALAYNLDGLLIAGDDGQDVVIHQEAGAANGMTLRDGNARGSKPFSVVLFFW